MRCILLSILSFFFFSDVIASSTSPIFVGSREGDPESLVKNVSAIHGDYSELELDFCIAGPDPLKLTRFYTSKDTLDIATFGGWRFQPQTFFQIYTNPNRKGYQTHQGNFECLDIFVGMEDGSILKFSGFQNWENPDIQSKFFVDLKEDEVGICNTSKGQLSKWTNTKNHRLYYDPKTKSFELQLSSGGKRIYIQDPKSKKFYLSLEILPSGNKISYEYDEKYRLTQLKMTNASADKIISRINLEYTTSIIAKASDGTSVEYFIEKDTSGILLLTKVKSLYFPEQYYYYQVEKSKALLSRKEITNDKYIKINYEKTAPYRVVSVVEPFQKGMEKSFIFTYGKGITEVINPLNQKTIYYYDKEKHITAIEETIDGSSYRIRKKKWGKRKNQGNLIALSTEDSAENVFYYKTFSYDLDGNILEETEYGNLSGQRPEPIVFDKKGRPDKDQEHFAKKYSYKKKKNEDVVSQINEQGNGILFAYIPNTFILKRKEILENKKIKKRFFYDYNEDGALVSIIIDNGDSYYHDKQKFITIIIPKQELPNLGTAEIIEEKAYDFSSENEILLKKTINHFDTCGRVIKQDFYDAEEVYSYSLETNYDNAEKVVGKKDPMGNQTTYTYDIQGNLTQEKILGLTIQYDYNLQNNLIGITRFGENCDNEKTTFAYDVMGNKVLEIDYLGNTTKYHYDPLGRMVEKINSKAKQTSESQTWIYVYNIFNHPIAVTDPVKNTITIENNIRGKPTHITGVDGKEEAFVYSVEGSLYRHNTSQGIKKTFEYDYLGRIKRIKYYERGSKKTSFKEDIYSYDAFNLLSESTTNGDIKYSYNNKGQLIQTIFAQKDSNVWHGDGGISDIVDGEATDFKYDSLGLLIETKKWKDSTRYSLYTYNYDLLGHVIEENIESEQGKLLHKKQFTYTSFGELFQEIGFPNNKKTILAEYIYDSLGRLSQIKKGNSSWDINYEKNKGSLKKIIKDPFGIVTEETYDSIGLLNSRIKKDSKQKSILEQQFTYDPLNNLVKEKNFNFEISYTHTPEALCKSITMAHTPSSSFWNFLSSSPEKQETLQHCFRYNSYGELTHSSIPSFEQDIEYTYDPQGNLTNLIYQETPNGKSKNYDLTIDKKGNITEVAQKESFNLEKTYNTHSQILTEEINDKWGYYNISFKYDQEGYITEIILPDKSFIKYIYDGPFVSKIIRFSKDKNELYTYEITDRDLMGNVLCETLPKNLGVRKNVYDDQGRKTETVSDFFSDKVILDYLGRPIEKHTKQEKEERKILFTYDSLSQLISDGMHFYQYDQLQNLILKDKNTYTINPYNQVIKSNDFKCEYDEAGNLKSFSDYSNTIEMQFDALGRLIFVKTSTGETLNYTYDFDSRRINKEIDAEDAERYFYLGGYELGALDEDGNIKALRIPINPNSLDNTSILSIELENEVFIPFLDLQRNVCCLVDPDRRTVVESYTFSAFGEEQIFSPRKQVEKSQLNNPWRFQSKRHDDETGLIYYGARYYCPKIQKWISPDPIGSYDCLNLYLFCHNNPLTYQDPWGFTSEENQSCQCGYCVRGEGWCHCRGKDLDNNIDSCACLGISCVCKQRGILSGVVDVFVNCAVDTWNSPHFQGGLQAFGGLTETMIGGGMALTSAGIAAPIGGVVMAHGLDHFFTGLQTAFTGKPRNTVTNQLLRKTGISSQTASMIDSGISIAGSMGGLVAIRASQLVTFPKFHLPISSNNSYVNRATSFAGSKRSPLKYAKFQEIRNNPGVINGRKYTGHALDRMQDRGLMPSVVENAIQNNVGVPNKIAGRIQFYDKINNISVVMEEGEIITIFNGRLN